MLLVVVLAVDYTKSNWTIGVQLFGRHILNEPIPEPVDHAIVQFCHPARVYGLHE